MLRLQIVLVLLAVIVSSSSSSPQQYGDVPEYLLPLFPEQFVEYLESLTPKETSALRDLAEVRGPFKTRGHFLYALSHNGKSLYKKNMNLEFGLRRKVAQLDGDAKNLAIHFINNAHKLYMNLLSGRKPTFIEVKAMVISYIDEFSKLPEASQAALMDQFPTFVNTITMSFVKDMLNWKPGRFVALDD